MYLRATSSDFNYDFPDESVQYVAVPYSGKLISGQTHIDPFMCLLYIYILHIFVNHVKWLFLIWLVESGESIIFR